MSTIITNIYNSTQARQGQTDERWGKGLPKTEMEREGRREGGWDGNHGIVNNNNKQRYRVSKPTRFAYLSSSVPV